LDRCSDLFAHYESKFSPHAIYLIVRRVFDPEALLDAGTGITFMRTMKLETIGSMISLESGLDSGAVAAAAAKTDSVVRQRLVLMTVLLFSVIVCTMVAFVPIMISKEMAICISESTIDEALIPVYAFGLRLTLRDKENVLSIWTFYFSLYHNYRVELLWRKRRAVSLGNGSNCPIQNSICFCRSS
jgi:hypothetical protein